MGPTFPGALALCQVIHHLFSICLWYSDIPS